MKNPLSELIFGSEDLYGDLFPVYFQGKMYKAEDCDPDYVNAYWQSEKLNGDSSVFLPNGNRIYPNGMKRFR